MTTPPRTILIVNADDFGRTPGINEGVFEAHARGIVSSATCMVAYPAATEAARAAARHPELGVGLHFALTGRVAPLAAEDDVPSLLDDDGLLPRHRDGLGGAESAEVELELRAQLARFRRLFGRLPTHLDGHHHVHRLPPVLEAVMAVARDHGLPVRAVTPDMAERLHAAGIATADRFDEDFYDQGATRANLLAFIDRLEPGVTELMCHPGRVDAHLRPISTYLEARERELAILTDPAVRQALTDRDITLADFTTLK